jgi:cellulose synthase/poly-beta-1,6-N-acetylglucosamine synthase-like glycosyltransferase
MIFSFLYAVTFLLLSVYVYFILKYIRTWKTAPDFSFKSAAGGISLTVLVPFRNEQENLPALLESFQKQSLSRGRWEVLFIDDHSTDESVSVVHKYCAGATNCRVIKNEGKGKKSALKTGIAKAAGDIIVTTDADCRFGKGRLSSVIAFHEHEVPDMTIMPVMMEGGASFMQKFFVADFLALQMVTAGSALTGEPLMCNGANLAFKKQDNDPDLKENYASGEDMFLLESMKKSGKKIRYLKSESAVVRTKAPGNIKQFIRQRSRWISKAGGYSDTFLLFFSLMVFAVNILTLVFAVLAISGFIPFRIFALWFIIKTLTDYSLIRSGFRFFDFRVSLLQFAVMQMLYPFYMLLVSFRGFLFRERWK